MTVYTATRLEPPARRGAHPHPQSQARHASKDRPAFGTASDRFNSNLSTKNWRLGDIAFLRLHSCFPASEQHLFKLPGDNPRKIHTGATSHPVIILKLSATHALVTTVSAYGTDDESCNVPPWHQRKHRRKDANDFRAFAGSVRSNPRHTTLLLEENRLMPKPKTSWAYVRSVYMVPLSGLGIFTKSKDQLRLQRSSYDDLMEHIGRRSLNFGALNRAHEWWTVPQLFSEFGPNSAASRA